jgi:hypothetical protein
VSFIYRHDRLKENIQQKGTVLHTEERPLYIYHERVSTFATETEVQLSDTSDSPCSRQLYLAIPSVSAAG